MQPVAAPVAPPRPPPAPEALYGILHAAVGIPLLTILFTSGFAALNRVDPQVNLAGILYGGAAVAALLLLGGGAWLTSRLRPWALATAVAGLPFGVLLHVFATDYSETHCDDVISPATCDQYGGGGMALLLAFLFVALAAVVVGAVLAGARGGTDAGGWLLAVSLPVCVGVLAASALILSGLEREAVEAAASNEPQVHYTPGLGALAAVASLLAVAVHRRRRQGAAMRSSQDPEGRT